MKFRTILMGLFVITTVVIYAQDGNKTADTREVVVFPKELKEHTLKNMRMHLQTLDSILEALAKDDPDKAADIAEHELGMSAMGLHGAKHAGKYMPPAMRKAGMTLHHKASQFALIAPEGNTTKTYAALREITLTCISCHAQFRFK